MELDDCMPDVEGEAFGHKLLVAKGSSRPHGSNVDCPAHKVSIALLAGISTTPSPKRMSKRRASSLDELG